MSAPRFEMDFARRPYRGGAAGVLFAVLGVLLLALTLAWQQRLDTRLAGLELRSADLQRRQQASGSAPPVAGLQRAPRTATLLAVPWSPLLAGLEKASAQQRADVAILAIEPDVARRRLKLSGEARNFNAVVEYVGRLQRMKSLRHPMLESHEIRLDDEYKPVRFQLTAEWVDAP